MDRKAWKAAAGRQVSEASGVKSITLAFVLTMLALAAAEWGLTELVSRVNSAHSYLSQAISAETRAYVIMVGISLVCQLLAVLARMGYTSFALRVSRGEAVSLDTLLDGGRIWSRTVLLYIYISVLLGLWSSLLSLPASYVLVALLMAGTITETAVYVGLTAFMLLVIWILSYRYRLAWFVLLDAPEKPVRQIVAEARAINQAHRVKLFLLDMSFVPLLLLCGLTAGVLLIWKLPYITATYANAYAFMLEDYQARRARMEALLEEQRARFRENGL